MHVEITYPWTGCSNFLSYSYSDLLASMLPVSVPLRRRLRAVSRLPQLYHAPHQEHLHARVQVMIHCHRSSLLRSTSPLPVATSMPSFPSPARALGWTYWRCPLKRLSAPGFWENKLAATSQSAPPPPFLHHFHHPPLPFFCCLLSTSARLRITPNSPSLPGTTASPSPPCATQVNRSAV